MRPYAHLSRTTSREARQFSESKGISFEGIRLKKLGEKQLEELIGGRDMREFLIPGIRKTGRRKTRSNPSSRAEALRVSAAELPAH